jgi:predicted ATPase
MKAIRLQNIRCLKDTGFIAIKPLNIIVGENSAGKSSFARIFPMFKQSIQENPQGPFLFDGDLVDFGGYKNMLSSDRQSEDMTISFSAELNYRDLGISQNENNSTFEAELSLTIKEHDNTPYISYVSIKFHHYTAEFEFFLNRLTEIKCNGESLRESFVEVFSLDDGVIFPIIFVRQTGLLGQLSGEFRQIGVSEKYTSRALLTVEANDDLRALVAIPFRKNVRADRLNLTIIELFKFCAMGYRVDEYMEFAKRNLGLKTLFSSKKQGLNLDRVLAFSAIKVAFLIGNSFNRLFTQTASNITYIAPLRATAQRYYRYRNISVREVDSRGENLPHFISSLSDDDLISLQSWMMDNFNMAIKHVLRSGHLTLEIQNNDLAEKFNIADSGFGYSQIMPVLVQLWAIVNKKIRREKNYLAPIIYVIEQPELHLHPRKQAEIAKIFCKAISVANTNEIDFRLIVETHSESIINRIGRSIYEKEIVSDDVSIVIFNKKASDIFSEIKHSYYDEKGQLQMWPWGFFD